MCVIVLDQREAAPPMRDGLHVCGRGVKGDGLVDALRKQGSLLACPAGPGPRNYLNLNLSCSACYHVFAVGGAPSR